MKFGKYSAAMFIAPLVAFALTQVYLLDLVGSFFGLTMPQDAGSRAMYSTVAAIFAVQMIVLAYVVSTLLGKNTKDADASSKYD